MLKAIKQFLKNLFSHKKPINPFINFWENFSYLMIFFYSLELAKLVHEHKEKVIWMGSRI